MENLKILLVACLVLFSLILASQGCTSSNSKEPLNLVQPDTIIHYPHVAPEISYSKVWKPKEIFMCEFNDPTKDQSFISDLERYQFPDSKTKEMIISNHYGAYFSMDLPDHPSGSDTVFFPTKDPDICDKLSGVRTVSVNYMTCMGDHYPPCWFGIGGLVYKIE